MDLLRELFGTSIYTPHGFCYLWNRNLVALHVISDALIALSYFAIPIPLLWVVRKRRDVPFRWMFFLFGAFIVACGGTHAMEVWNVWHANYWLSGVLKAVTAAVSVPTAMLLAKLVPDAIEFPSAKQWIEANAQLREEIGERREAELNLRISEAKFREQAELLDLTYDAILVRNLQHKILYWNRGAERIYGWTSSEAVEKNATHLFHSEYPKSLDGILLEILEKGHWEGQIKRARRDGSSVIVAVRWALRRDFEGRPVSIIETNHDITWQMQEETKFRDLLEAAPDAFVIVNEAGRIVIANAQTEKLFGYARAELVGQGIEVLIPERFRHQHGKHRTDYAANPKSRPMGAGLELLGRRNDGSEFPVEVSLSPLKTEEGMLIISAVRDVTSRHASEQKVQLLNEALNKKVVELSLVNKELESFSYSVSHDLRAPLRHIDGFARLLQEEYAEELPAEGIRYLDRILHAVTHLGNLVDDLLRLARIGRTEMRKQNVKLTDVVRQAMSDLPPEADREIEWRIEALPDAECDAGLLGLVFANLLANAVKFTRTRAPAVIEVGSHQDNGTAVYFVRDNGVGFDPKYADKLFGVFQRLHRQDEFEGTGVGLATVQRIIQRHGGSIWAKSQPGIGTAFFFTLEPKQGGAHEEVAQEIGSGTI